MPAKYNIDKDILDNFLLPLML